MVKNHCSIFLVTNGLLVAEILTLLYLEKVRLNVQVQRTTKCYCWVSYVAAMLVYGQELGANTMADMAAWTAVLECFLLA